MTVNALAGYMRERHLWQLLRDIAAIQSRSMITPETIQWDGSRFGLLEGQSVNKIVAFLPPENNDYGQLDEANRVWMLGATVFYLFMGCYVFNGRGGAVQRGKTPVPYMRQSMPELSTLVCQMLSFCPQARPTMEHVTKVAQENLQRLDAYKPQRPCKTLCSNVLTTQLDFWNDEF
ncbi:MAG: hypothetical protein LIO91_06625 [Bacteroidales bacterium]|nr:hypothetical protein [Bacteroidales bacterium]